MSRRITVLFAACAVVTSAVLLSAQTAKLRTTWAAPGVGPTSWAGKKVAVVAISSDMNVRMSAEEAMVREVTPRGPQAVAAYRAIPKELLADKDQAQQWFAKSGVAGVIAMRVVNVDTSLEYSTVVVGAAYYQSFYSFYDYGLATVVPIGDPKQKKTYAVETLLFDIAGGGKMIWAGMSETTDPKTIGTFVEGLAKAVVRDLEKKKLIAKK